MELVGYLIKTDAGFDRYFDMGSNYSVIVSKDIISKQYNGINDAKDEAMALLKQGELKGFALVDFETKRPIFRASANQVFNYFDEAEEKKIKGWLSNVCESESFSIVEKDGKTVVMNNKKIIPCQMTWVDRVIMYFASRNRNIEKILIKNLSEPLEWHLSKKEKGSIVITCGIH